MSIEQAIAAAVRSAITEHLPHTTPAVPAHDAIQPWRTYSIPEAADLTGIAKSTLYDTPALPKIRTGAAGTGRRILGLHLLCYLAQVDPPDLAAYIESLVQSRTRGTVRPITDKRTRVI